MREIVGSESPITLDNVRGLSPSFCAARTVALVSAALSGAVTGGTSSASGIFLFFSLISEEIIYDIYFYWKRILEMGKKVPVQARRYFFRQINLLCRERHSSREIIQGVT
jgi:hypothetical protein